MQTNDPGEASKIELCQTSDEADRAKLTDLASTPDLRNAVNKDLVPLRDRISEALDSV